MTDILFVLGPSALAIAFFFYLAAREVGWKATLLIASLSLSGACLVALWFASAVVSMCNAAS